MPGHSPIRRFAGWQILMVIGIVLWGLLEILERGARAQDNALSPITAAFTVLLQYLRHEHTFSVLQAGAMTGLYVLLLYALMAWQS